MSVLLKLLEFGVEATQTGDDPKNEKEYLENIVILKGTRPAWTELNTFKLPGTKEQIKEESSRRMQKLMGATDKDHLLFLIAMNRDIALDKILQDIESSSEVLSKELSLPADYNDDKHWPAETKGL